MLPLVSNGTQPTVDGVVSYKREGEAYPRHSFAVGVLGWLLEHSVEWLARFEYLVQSPPDSATGMPVFEALWGFPVLALVTEAARFQRSRMKAI